MRLQQEVELEAEGHNNQASQLTGNAEDRHQPVVLILHTRTC